MALVKMRRLRDGIVSDIHESNVLHKLNNGWEVVEGAAPSLPEPVKAEIIKPEVEIPKGWETAHHFTKIKIARRIDPDFQGASQDAEALIRKTLEARQSLF